MEKPLLQKRKLPPVLKKRKNIKPMRRCQNVIDDGYYSGNEKICNRPVHSPNKYLCQICLRHTESETQATGREL